MIIFNVQAHYFNLLLPRGSCYYVFFFSITKPRKKLDVDLAQVNITEKALLSYFLAIHNYYF